MLILEETEAIGGLSRTVAHNGNRMDIGGHRFFSKDERITNWWLSLMPLQGSPASDDPPQGRRGRFATKGPDPEQEDKVMLRRRRVSRIFYRGKFFSYPLKPELRTFTGLGLSTTAAAAFSYLKAALWKRREHSLQDFYINRFGRKLYSMFFEGYTEKLWGRAPKELSADWGAQRVKGLSVKALLRDFLNKVSGRKNFKNTETSLIEEFLYPKYGPGQLWEEAAKEFTALGGEIRKGCRVEGLRMKGKKVTSVTYRNGTESFAEEADILLSSMPLKELVEAMETASPEIRSVAAGLPYRDFVTVGLLVKKLSLKAEASAASANALIPDCWIYLQDSSVLAGRLQLFNNWSPYLVKKPADTVWLSLEYFCTEGDSCWQLSEEEWLSLTQKELERLKIIEGGEKILDFHCEKVKKAYPAYFDTYSEMNTLRAYLDIIENLYCIGRNGQHRYNNMDHSMATAFEAVSNILSGRKDKSNVWNVNTDKSYNEEK